MRCTCLMSLLLCLAIAAVPGLGQDGSAEQRLLEWVESRGGQLHVTVGLNAQGVRGLLAKQAMRKGSVLLSVPASLAIHLGSSQDTAPELAVLLLRERHRARTRFQPYLDALPGLWDTPCAEALPQSVLPLLDASPRLAQLVGVKQAWAQHVLQGDVPARYPVSRVLPGKNISAQEFNWAACMASSRALSSPSGSMHLLPVIDMANHREGSPHIVRWQVEDERAAGGTAGMGWLELVAGVDVAEGEEVTISYGPLRPDEAALYYGYPLHDATDERGGARLCAVDHAQYDPELRPGKQEWPEFSGSHAEMVQELKRLEDLAASYQSAMRGWQATQDAAVGECLRMEAQQLCLNAVQLLAFTMQSCAEGVEQEQRRLRAGLDREL